jgi:hypothetical protein
MAVDSSWAQQTTGSLEGRILDEGGEPVAYANIVVSGPNLQGARGTISTTDGYFRIPSLPIGVYIVNISHITYQALTYHDIAIQLGKTTSLPETRLSVRVHEAPEVVVVVARKPLVDVATSAVSTSFQSRALEDLPTGRNFRSFIALAPQANASSFGDETNIAGSTGPESIYYIDGIHVTEPSFGETSTNLPYNFVREIEIKTGGYEAEYGRALGGIVNVVTHSGSNNFHGQLFGFFTNDRFVATSRSGLGEPKIDEFAQYDIGGSVAGPIVHEKLWYFVAYNPNFNNVDIEVPDLGFQKDTKTLHLFAGKLTWRATTRTDLDLTILGDPARQDGVGNLFAGSFVAPPTGLSNLDPFLTKRKEGGIALSLQARHLLGDKAFLTASLSHVSTDNDFEPSTLRGLTEPLFADTTGTWSDGYGGFFTAHGSRFAAKIAGSLFAGNHILKAGVEYEGNSLDANQEAGFGKAGGGFIQQLDASTWHWFGGFTVGTLHNRVPSLFVQDSWLVTKRLRLNAGLRWEAEYIEGSDGARAMSITDEWQPRAGFIYELGGKGTQKLFGSYGRFYEQFATFAPGYQWLEGRILGLSYDHDPRLDPAGADTAFAFVGGDPQIATDVKGEHFDEFTLGYEHLVLNRLKFGVRAAYRTLGEIVEDTLDPSRGEFVLGNPGRGELGFAQKPRRDYWALEFTVEKSDLGRAQFLASYVFSKNFGNYPGVANTDLRGNSGNANFSYDFVDLLDNGTGALPNDRPHVFKFFGSYRFDFGLSAGTWFSWQSGTPLSEYGGHPAGLPYWSFLRQRGTAGRMPALLDLNLRFAYDLKQRLGSTLRPRLIVDLFHVLNRRTEIDIDQRHFFGVDEETGNQIGQNPNYLRPTLHQPPMSARLGLEVGF